MDKADYVFTVLAVVILLVCAGFVAVAVHHKHQSTQTCDDLCLKLEGRRSEWINEECWCLDGKTYRRASELYDAETQRVNGFEQMLVAPGVWI